MDAMKAIKTELELAAKELGVEISAELSRPDEKFGDYASNIAMQLAGKLGGNPRELAERLAERIKKIDDVRDVEIAGPGFINIWLTDQALWAMANTATELPKPYAGQSIVAEYSDPNPFKVLHAGHLYTSVVGDAIANLYEAGGATVHRVNFGGDVGLHVAKSMWGIIKYLGGENPAGLEAVGKSERPDWLSQRYVEGNEAYEQGDAKPEIDELNKKVYSVQASGDHQSPFAQIYWTCRQWSYDYFDEFYKSIGSGFEKYYPESETVAPGLEAVRRHMGDVFVESDGAVVFKGETHNLHTRVFINSQGLPTYETKDVGLILKKWQDYHFDKSIIITGNDIYDYMQVVLKAVEQFEPELVSRTRHITHGMVRLAGGQKMSSRKGNVLRAVDVIEAATQAASKVNDKQNHLVVLGAVKYAFLRYAIGGDITYDPDESVAIAGNSGPYLQYAHARARSILAKAKPGTQISELQPGERILARKISEFPEVVTSATYDLAPSHICTYLYELAQEFNRFYEANRVVGDAREATRAVLVSAYADVLKTGLSLLNIEAPEEV